VRVIDAYASRPQYWRHLDPVVAALRSAGHQVTVWSPVGVEAPWGVPLTHPARLAPTVLVASETDTQAVSRAVGVIYLEHGAGQTYVDGLEGGQGYAGGPGLDRCRLFLCPSEHVAARWRARYDAPAVAIGCPALDRHHDVEMMGPDVRVYLTAHWRCAIAPETWWALDDFGPALPGLRDDLTASGVQLIGHAHPRDARRIAERWRELGIDYEPDPDQVLRNADLLIADNTSLMYEAAALEIPVLALNARRYRRDVEHGLRFWSHVPGLQCDDPADLIQTVHYALDDIGLARDLRRAAAMHAYAAVDGHASDRAVSAIERVLA
jgi:hypothetical protein